MGLDIAFNEVKRNGFGFAFGHCDGEHRALHLCIRRRRQMCIGDKLRGMGSGSLWLLAKWQLWLLDDAKGVISDELVLYWTLDSVRCGS